MVDLLRDTNCLSIQQMVAYYTLIMVHKVMLTGKPSYIAGKLRLRDESARELRAWGGRTIETPTYTLDTSRAGFVYRGSKLYNTVSRNLREETSIAKFKRGAKKWVTEQIPVRPGR